MNWKDIIWELKEDEVIDAYQNNDLRNSYNSLNGLYSMSEIGIELKDEFILEVINCVINERNVYGKIDGEYDLEYVKIEDGEFVWDSNCYGGN